jgi:hypothetical protein
MGRTYSYEGIPSRLLAVTEVQWDRFFAQDVGGDRLWQISAQDWANGDYYSPFGDWGGENLANSPEANSLIEIWAHL